MKLKKLTIKNFRSIRGDENEISFDGSNIIFLVGQNNVGKSSILNAYSYFVSSSQVVSVEDFHDYDKSVPIEIEGWFIKEDGDESDADLSGTGKTKEPDWFKKWVDDDCVIKIKKVWETVGSGFKKQTFDPQKEE